KLSEKEAELLSLLKKIQISEDLESKQLFSAQFQELYYELNKSHLPVDTFSIYREWQSLAVLSAVSNFPEGATFAEIQGLIGVEKEKLKNIFESLINNGLVELSSEDLYKATQKKLTINSA